MVMVVLVVMSGSGGDGIVTLVVSVMNVTACGEVASGTSLLPLLMWERETGVKR